MEGGLRVLVAGLFKAWRSVGIHAHTRMLEASCTQHSLEDVQDRDVCTHCIPA